MTVDYTAITETPGTKASKEQLERLYQRYRFAYQFCSGKDVLEAACGAGQGLGYLATAAKKVIGGDIDKDNLKFAQMQYEGKSGIQIEVFDAQKLPFEDESFDVAIMYEAIYYLTDPAAFIGEAYRTLRNNGLLIMCTVNKDWADFNPSLFSIRYFSVPELDSLLKQRFVDVDFYGGFLAGPNSPKGAIVSFIKRTAVRLQLMPKTMKGKEPLKRIFFGKLYPLPPEVKEDMAEYVKPVPISRHSPNNSYKVIFAVARKGY